MSILDTLFGRAPQAQTQAPNNPTQQPFNPNAAPNPANSGTPQTVQLAGTQPQGVANNPLVPNGNNTPTQLDPNTGKPAATDPPMSKFKDVFTITPNPDAAQQPSFDLNPETFNAQLAQMDFASDAFTPELSAQILKGGEEAIQAMATVMNKVGRNAFAKAAHFTTKATEFGYTQSKKSIITDLPSQLRRQSAMQTIYEAHPGLNNAATKPLVDSMTASFTEKYPNATDGEIQNLLIEYFDGVGSLITRQPTPQSARDKSRAEASDFSNFLPESNR